MKNQVNGIKRSFDWANLKALSVQPHVSPDSNNLAPVEHNPIHLGNKDGGHRLIKRCAVHVDGRAHWEHKTCYSLVDPQVLLQAPECDRQGTGTAANKAEKKVA